MLYVKNYVPVSKQLFQTVLLFTISVFNFKCKDKQVSAKLQTTNKIMSKNIKFLIYRLTIYQSQLYISLKKNYKRQVI